MSRLTGLTSSPARSQKQHTKQKIVFSKLKVDEKCHQTVVTRKSQFKLCSQPPVILHALQDLEYTNDNPSGTEIKRKKGLIPPPRNITVDNNTKIEEIQCLWEERANRWSVSKQWILDQEDIVYYKMISPPLMESLTSCYAGEFAIATTRALHDDNVVLCLETMSQEEGNQIFERSFWSFLNDVGPKPFYFSQIHTCHKLWNTYVDGNIWKTLKLDLLPWAYKESCKKNMPSYKAHTKHFEVHIPFGFSLDPAKSEDTLKTVTLDDVGFDEEGLEDTLVCMQEVFLYLFFNQFLLTPRFLRCAWRPLYGEIALITEKYEGDLTMLPRTVLRHSSKQELLAELSQEILFLVRSISLLGWFCFDLKPQNMVFKWSTPSTLAHSSASRESKLSIKMIDFDARYYASAQLPFSVLFWCNLYALCLNFEGIHRWKSKQCGTFWWWEEGTANLLLKVLNTDLSVGLRTCSILWTHLAVVEQNNPNQFIDPFYVTWFYCKKHKHTFKSRQELYVQITAFIYNQWTVLAGNYINSSQ